MADKKILLSRQEAIKIGSIRYFTGKPCKKGHIAERQLSNGSCIECRNEDRREFYRKDPSKTIQWVKNWESRNSDWVSARNKRWKAENYETVRAHNRNRKARKRANGGSHTAADVLDILRMQRSKCACCQRPLKNKMYHVDHIIPLIKGGSNDRRNLQILCVTCNLSKSALDPLDFMRSKGKLL